MSVPPGKGVVPSPTGSSRTDSPAVTVATAGSSPSPPTVVVHVVPPSVRRKWAVRLLLLLLLISFGWNLALFSSYQSYFNTGSGPDEKYHAGSKTSSEKIALIKVSGTIMAPFTERIIKAIEKVGDDEKVKGVLLVVDSPGGMVADSHQIYHALKKLQGKKPISVVMKRMAASGGYYISMGAGPDGKIYAEPTTWTGSIGVIIPRYDASKLAGKLGVDSDPIKTGPFKDALSPFRQLSEDERKLWDDILQESFEQFVEVIDENRSNLDRAAVKKLATGQIYTAKQAKANGLVDVIGFEEDAIRDMEEKLGITDARVVIYDSSIQGLLNTLLGQATGEVEKDRWKALLESTTPRGMYFCSWAPPLPF